MDVFYSHHARANVCFHRTAGAGPALLILHGLGGAGWSEYAEVAGGLPGRSIVVPDLLGFGESDHAAEFGYGLQEHAHVLAELIEHLSLERFVLFGHSMGGSIAIGLANQMPARIAGLILVDPNLHGGGGILSRRVVAYTERSYALHGHVELATELAAQGHPAWAETWRRANAVALHRSAASLVKGTSPSWRDTLAALHLQRTLIISRDYGREDDVALLARSGVRVNPILDAGHFMNLEQPLALANAIRLAVTS